MQDKVVGGTVLAVVVREGDVRLVRLELSLLRALAFLANCNSSFILQ